MVPIGNQSTITINGTNTYTNYLADAATAARHKAMAVPDEALPILLQATIERLRLIQAEMEAGSAASTSADGAIVPQRAGDLRREGVENDCT